MDVVGDIGELPDLSGLEIVAMVDTNPEGVGRSGVAELYVVLLGESVVVEVLLGIKDTV